MDDAPLLDVMDLGSPATAGAADLDLGIQEL
jgi:hypothetical protein